jgi:hypothetical protein
MNPATGKAQRVLVSGRGLRTLRKWMKVGKMFDLNALAS